MAIIPMQMKMVYRIDKSHGAELDRSHIKEFLATAGIGAGSQIVEGFARSSDQGQPLAQIRAQIRVSH